MIYLVPEFKSSIGDDTFWTWFAREFESSFDPPPEVNSDDRILQYAMLGPSKIKGGKKVACLWELYPELKKYGLADNSAKVRKMHRCYQESDLRTTSSAAMLDYYPKATILPIGVDTDLFCPKDKQSMRKRRRIPLDRKVGFWCGTDHPMKGYDRKLKYQAEHPDIFWITVFKGSQLPQEELSELMSCADFALFTSRLRPYYMTEWECMACNVPIVDISGVARDFIPSSTPRDDVMRLGWSRQKTKEAWQEFLS